MSRYTSLLTRQELAIEGRCPIAIVGMGCLFPQAPGLKEFWRLIRCGLDGITNIPPTHWSPDDYFDTDATAPDMTYCRRGGFLGTVPFDPTEFGIPPTALEATDTAQLLALVVAKAALADVKKHRGSNSTTPTESGNAAADPHGRTSVILGVTGTQELVIPLGARLGHPIWRRALRAAGIDEVTADDVVRRISDGYVGWQENSFPGLLGNVVAGRIANRLDLHGTNCVVDAACASSLSAVHLAVMELQSGRADTVVSGGVDALNDIFMHMCFSKTPALSLTGDARPFSASADGTVLGEGIGMVVLKRLADAQRDGDRVYAVIKAVGTSSDGRQNSIYAPYADGQAMALRRAYAEAGFGPETVELVEAHGTGTKVGDVVEFAALRSVFEESQPYASGAAGADDSERAGWCAVGSIKSQIGHTKAAAGAAGLIKAALALYHKVLPPTVKVDAPNSKLSVDESPFYINSQVRPWQASAEHPRRAGVSSFGFGGSNFHIVLEEPPPSASPKDSATGLGAPAVAWDGSVEIVAISATDAAGLCQGLDAIMAECGDTACWSDLSAVAAQSRATFDAAALHRLLIVLERGLAVGAPAGSTIDPGVTAARSALAQARDALVRETSAEWTLAGVYRGSGPARGGLAMLFPGQGSQYVGMVRDLASVFGEFRSALAIMDHAARQPDRPMATVDGELAMSRLVDVIYPPTPSDRETAVANDRRLTRTELAQPALGAVEMGLHRTLSRFGIVADAVAGHSYGELVALHASGRLPVETFARVSWLRGRTMSRVGRCEPANDQPWQPDGAMLAVEAPLDEIERLITDNRLSVVLANRNAPRQGVLSGPAAEISAAQEACRERGFRCKRLNVSAAFHTRDMQPAANSFADGLLRADFQESSVPVFANVTALPYPADANGARDVLCRQMTAPVDFVGQVANLYASGIRTFVEVGPKAVLTGLVRATLQGRDYVAVALDASAGSRSGMADLARALAQLAAAGHRVQLNNWEAPAEPRRRPKMIVPLCGANYRAPRTKAVPDATTAVSTRPEPVKPAARVVVSPARATAVISDFPVTGVCMMNETEVNRAANPVQVSVLQDALRVVADGMRAMQVLQQQTAEAHQRFLEGQSLAHRTMQSMMEGQQRLLERAVGLSPSNMPALVAAPGSMSAPVEAPIRSNTTRAESNSVVANWSAARTTGDGGAARLIHENGGRRNGGPVSDSVGNARPAWVPPAMAEESPWADERPAAVAPPTNGPAVAAMVTPRAVAVSTAPMTAAAPVRVESAGIEARFSEALLAVVSELTGYPRDMLQLEMDLEADLGIDSIKRVEILAAVQERMPDTKAVNPEYMGSLRTLAQIVDYCIGDKKKVM